MYCARAPIPQLSIFVWDRSPVPTEIRPCRCFLRIRSRGGGAGENTGDQELESSCGTMSLYRKHASIWLCLITCIGNVEEMALRHVSSASKAVLKTGSPPTAILRKSAANIGKSPIKLESYLSQFWVCLSVSYPLGGFFADNRNRIISPAKAQIDRASLQRDVSGRYKPYKLLSVVDSLNSEEVVGYGESMFSKQGL